MPKRKKRSRAEWTRLVEEWQASDLSQQAYAKREGIAPTTLSWWACRLRREARAQGPALVPVEVVADEASAACAPALRVDVAGGRTVVVPAGFDAETLRRLVTILEDRAC